MPQQDRHDPSNAQGRGQGRRRRMTDLTGIIGDLIATRKEGDHWDFKREPHDKIGDLIKDIICLANSPRHTGDRYIIYGVDDTGTVVGLQSATPRTQADIVSTLFNVGFAGGVYPDIYLEQIELQDQRLEVLVIKDRPEKPYYLQKEYNKRGVRLNPGTVYSRVRDSNTPSDQVASSHDIERMWRERFGLDQTPFQRVQNYLLDRDSWIKTSENTWFYSQCPEFTISPTEEEAWPALSVAAFEGTTQVEVPPLSIGGFIQTSLPGWCLKVASVVDVVVWMMVGNPSTDKERRTVVCKERRASA